VPRASSEPNVEESQPPETAGVIAPPPLIFAGGFLCGLVIDRAVPQSRPWPAALRRVLAPILLAGGVLCMLAAVRTMWSARTTINPAAPVASLVTTGPFRFTRNPIYLGDTLFYTGLSLALGRRGPLVLLPAALALVERGVIRREERYLERRFGAPYRAYRARVRRWL
jgi:protein-S-isoprenylcysteine O-methyltransferase Ste14